MLLPLPLSVVIESNHSNDVYIRVAAGNWVG